MTDKSVIPSAVSQDQTAYIKHRYMGNNIRLMEDVIKYFDSYRKRGLLFMVDFKKALQRHQTRVPRLSFDTYFVCGNTRIQKLTSKMR